MSSENRVGEVLASKYRLEELLGSGGMGHVYRAVNEHVGRTVAIKVLRKEHSENAQVVERFLREARAANLVRHPNVVDVLDIGKEDGGSPFIVQELLTGEDLAHLVERRGGKLPLEEVCDLLLPVIDAVAEAHLRGVVHRDIKPENVFLARGAHGPVPKLLDFGISKVRASDLRATEVGLMMGTPAYMAPEQIQGAREADPRSDVWALGVMMFELIAGRMPFEGQDAPALFVAIATRDAPTLLAIGANATPEISQLVERCLRRQPDERYPSAAELGRDLRHVVDGSELEPTGRHSIPPSIRAVIPELDARLVPDLDFPAAGTPPRGAGARAAAASSDPASVATELGYAAEAPVPAVDGSAALRLASPKPPPSARSQPIVARLPEEPRAPSGRPSGRNLGGVVPPPPPPPPSLPDLSLRPSERELRAGSRLAPGASLPGVVLAPGPSSQKFRGTHASWGAPTPHPEPAGTTTIIGIGVVGLVAILATGLLMQLVHRPDGWPLAAFASLPPAAALPLHLLVAAAAVVVGMIYGRRGVRQWRGDLPGGRAGAVSLSVVAGGAFFCAIELASAVL